MERSIISNAAQLNYTRSLSKKESDQVIKATSILFVKKGDTVFSENEKLQSLYCIQKGVCKFSKIDDKGRENITKLLGEGELMGRRSVISNKGSVVSAKAVTDIVLCQLEKKPFLESLNNNNAFCMDVLNGFIADIKTNEEALRIFYSNKSIKSRLAGLLCYLKDKFGTEKGGSLIAKLKREDMAGIIGTTSEYVIRLLQYFKQEGYIKTEGRAIHVTAIKGLRSLSKN